MEGLPSLRQPAALQPPPLTPACRDDPTVLAWSLANEPRCRGDVRGATVGHWAAETAAWLKGLDPNHMVGLGRPRLHLQPVLTTKLSGSLPPNHVSSTSFNFTTAKRISSMKIRQQVRLNEPFLPPKISHPAASIPPSDSGSLQVSSSESLCPPPPLPPARRHHCRTLACGVLVAKNWRIFLRPRH